MFLAFLMSIGERFRRILVFGSVGYVFLFTQLDAHAIVFVHLGPYPPAYLSIAIEQARLFNPDCPIYLIGHDQPLKLVAPQIEKFQVTLVGTSSLKESVVHQRFRQFSRHNKESMHGYWFYTVERFFYLEEFMRQYRLTDLFHLESDVMLYCNLEELLPNFQAHYQGMMGVTFEGYPFGVPGFVYIQSAEPISQLVSFFSRRASLKETDIEMLGRFLDIFKNQYIKALPVLPIDHEFDLPNAGFYSTHFLDFSSVFDGAAYGIYLGGVDESVHDDWYPGADAANAAFKPSYFQFQWEFDVEGRLVPYLAYKGKKVKINNLHVACKRLDLFYSLNRESQVIQGQWTRENLMRE